MRYYQGKYREARRQWLDLAYREARNRGLEFERDSDQEAFHIPGNRAVRVRASMEQRPVIGLVLNDLIKAIQGEYDNLGDRFLLVVLLINNPDEYDPEQDDFIPIRDTLLERGSYTTEREDGTTQLTINVNEAPFKRTMNKWSWIFEK
jgi:hypothetical protein